MAIAALATVVLLAACEAPLVPPVEVDSYQLLRSTGPVVAVQVTISYQPSHYDFLGISGVPAGALVHTYDNGGGSITIGLLANGPALSGQLLRLNWSSADVGVEPAFTTRAAYDATLASVNSRLELGALTPVVGPSGATALSVLDHADSAVGSSGASGQVTPTSVDDELSATFADYPLGDLDRTGTVDVRDAYMALAIVNDGAATEAYDRYHADLTGDYLVTMNDVTAALKKAVDPTVPAQLVVKPARLTYVELVAGKPVLVGNGGSAAFTGLSFLEENPRGPAFAGAKTSPVAGQSAVYQFTSQPNDVFGQLTVSAGAQSAVVTVGNIVILVAGQSNASGLGLPAIPGLENGEAWPEVRALTNDYRWLPAVEPLDSPYNQGMFDPVSLDGNAAVSPGVHTARLLNRGSPSAGVVATDRFVYLIPTALGGSSLAPSGGVGWYLDANDLAGTDRLTLFGSAAYRGLVSAGLRDMPAAAVPSEHAAEGGPVSTVFWYQGESDSRDTTRRSNYVAHTGAVFAAFENHFETGAGAPAIIYAQLAPHGWDPEYPSGTPETPAAAEAKDRMQMDIAERQRRMEQGAYAGTPYLSPASGLGSPRANSFMVVTNDLPRSDRIHLSSAGQLKLAERIALAYQEHVLGLEVDGTGPRLTGITRSGNVITVKFDREVTEAAAPGPNGYFGYFRVWDGVPTPSGLTDSDYGSDTELAISDVRRHPDDPRAVRITLASTPSSYVHVRYMRPFEPTIESSYIEDVIRGVDSGLPLPSFGPLRVN